MRKIVFVVLLCLVGCRPLATNGRQGATVAPPAGAAQVPVSGRNGGEVQLTQANQGGVVRQPVAGGGRVVGSAVVWEYDTVTLQQLTGTIRSTNEDAIQQALRNALNEWGAQGWELVTVSGDTYIFKRPSTGF